MDTELLAVLTKVAECGGMVDDPATHSHQVVVVVSLFTANGLAPGGSCYIHVHKHRIGGSLI